MVGIFGAGECGQGFPSRQVRWEASVRERSPTLTSTSFDVLRAAVFFYIKCPLRVEEAGLQELIPTTWWPHRSGREVGGLGGVAGGSQSEGPSALAQGWGWWASQPWVSPG